MKYTHRGLCFVMLLLSCSLFIFASDTSESYYINSQNRFRLLEYDGEILDVTFNKEGGITRKVLAEENRTIIKSFDFLMRVIEQAVLSQLKDNKLVSKTTFLYDEKSTYPVESNEIDYEAKTKKKCSYDSKGYIVAKKMYSGNYSVTIPQDVEEKLLILEKFSYDNDNRIIEYIKKADETEIKQISSYAKGFSHPDTKFFVNSILREEIQYTDEQLYTKIIYFDNNQSIVAVYEDGIKKEELYKSGSKILRRTHY